MQILSAIACVRGFMMHCYNRDIWKKLWGCLVAWVSLCSGLIMISLVASGVFDYLVVIAVTNSL